MHLAQLLFVFFLAITFLFSISQLLIKIFLIHAISFSCFLLPFVIILTVDFVQFDFLNLVDISIIFHVEYFHGLADQKLQIVVLSVSFYTVPIFAFLIESVIIAIFLTAKPYHVVSQPFFFATVYSIQ